MNKAADFPRDLEETWAGDIKVRVSAPLLLNPPSVSVTESKSPAVGGWGGVFIINLLLNWQLQLDFQLVNATGSLQLGLLSPPPRPIRSGSYSLFFIWVCRR